MSTPVESEVSCSGSDKKAFWEPRLASPTIMELDNLEEWGPSIRELIQSYNERPWSHTCQLNSFEDARYVAGCMLHKSNTLGDKIRRRDRDILVAMISINNSLFSEFQKLQAIDTTGFFSKLLLDDKDALYVRADLRSDLSTLISHLECLGEGGYLDENFLPKKGVTLVFCGDYGGKGVNDVQVLTLLCAMKIRRPASVILLKGDGESTTSDPGLSSDARWIRNVVEINKLFTAFYNTLPLAVCIAVRPCTPLARPEYVHISHAGFSPSVDLSPLLDGPETAMVLPLFPKNTQRFKQLSERKFFSDIPPKSKSAFELLRTISRKDVWSTKSYSCIGLGELEGKGIACPFRFTAQRIQQYLTIAGKESRVKALIAGHNQTFKELSVTRKDKITPKVIATVLPAGCITGQFRDSVNPQVKQGLLLKVSPRVADWSKRFVITKEVTGLRAVSRISEESYAMFEPTEPVQSPQ